MFVVRSGLGRITAAYLDRQFPRQKWLPIQPSDAPTISSVQDALQRDPNALVA